MPKDTPQIERCRVNGRFEIKATQLNEDGTFAGYGSVFDNPHETSSRVLSLDDWTDVMAPGAFTKTIAEHKARGTLPAMLCQHDMFSLPIGAYTEVRQDDTGLYVEGKLALKVSRAGDVYELMKIGAMRGLSIGFKPTRFALDEKAKLRTIQEVDLWEISPVTIPADPLARVDDVKSGGFSSIREFEAHLRDVVGFSRKAAKAIAADGWKAVAPRRDAEVGDVAEGANSIAASIESVAEDFAATSRRDAEKKAREAKELAESIERAANEWSSQRDVERALDGLVESVDAIADALSK